MFHRMFHFFVTYIWSQSIFIPLKKKANYSMMCVAQISIFTRKFCCSLPWVSCLREEGRDGHHVMLAPMLLSTGTHPVTTVFFFRLHSTYSGSGEWNFNYSAVRAWFCSPAWMPYFGRWRSLPPSYRKESQEPFVTKVRTILELSEDGERFCFKFKKPVSYVLAIVFYQRTC